MLVPMRDPAVLAVFAVRITAAELASIEAGLPSLDGRQESA